MAFIRTPILAAALAASLWGCGGDRGEDPSRRQSDGEDAPIPAVEAVQARQGSLPLHERVTGTVRAAGQVAIYPQASGPISEVLVRNGDKVETGDPLVRIRPVLSESQLAQARANLAAAKAEVGRARASVEELEAGYSRTRLLAEKDLVSEEQLETERAQVEAARAVLAQAQAQVDQAAATLRERSETLRQTVVRAPITGRVGQRNAEVGMQAGPQTPLFVIGSLDRMRVEVPVTQEMLSRLKVGQRAEIRAESLPDTVLLAEVSRISPFLRERSFSAEAEIDVPNTGGLLMPGMFVTADIYYGGSQEATLVPESALYENPDTGEEGVFVLASGSPGSARPAPGDSAAPSVDTTTSDAPADRQPAPGQPAGEEGVGTLSGPLPLRFRAVDVLAVGDQVSGISRVEPGEWVVVVGQHLLPGRPGEKPVARVRPVTWERIVGLQTLQRHDLLRRFMEKQQRMARRRADSLSEAGGGREGPAGGGKE